MGFGVWGLGFMVKGLGFTEKPKRGTRKVWMSSSPFPEVAMAKALAFVSL